MKSEFKRLARTVYADFGGCPPCSEAVVSSAAARVCACLAPNPHSSGSWAAPGGPDWGGELRRRLLGMCRAAASDYACVLTPGATAGLHLVGQCFPWRPGSRFAYLEDNHTSVLGIRELAARGGAAVTALSLRGGGERGDGVPGSSTPASACIRLPGDDAPDAAAQPCLLALPLESNFHGVRYGLAARPSGHWRVLLDAAKGAASEPPDLSDAETAPDFVVLSCYKLFGYPTGEPRGLLARGVTGGGGGEGVVGVGVTGPGGGAGRSAPSRLRWPSRRRQEPAPARRSRDGDPHVCARAKSGCCPGLGALLIKTSLLPELEKAYFGGGTVAAALAGEPFHRRRAGAAGYEDGTPNFLAFPAACAGFEFIDRLGGWPAVGAHGRAVARRLASSLAALRHANGASVCRLHGAWTGTQALLGGDGSGADRGSDGAEAGRSVPARGGEPAGAGDDRPRNNSAGPLAKRDLVVRLTQGPTVTFSVFWDDGSPLGYRQLEQLASLQGIHLRTGCLCNPGACARALGLSSSGAVGWWGAGTVGRILLPRAP